MIKLGSLLTWSLTPCFLLVLLIEIRRQLVLRRKKTPREAVRSNIGTKGRLTCDRNQPRFKVSRAMTETKQTSCLEEVKQEGHKHEMHHISAVVVYTASYLIVGHAQIGGTPLPASHSIAVQTLRTSKQLTSRLARSDMGICLSDDWIGMAIGRSTVYLPSETLGEPSVGDRERRCAGAAA